MSAYYRYEERTSSRQTRPTNRHDERYDRSPTPESKYYIRRSPKPSSRQTKRTSFPDERDYRAQSPDRGYYPRRASRPSTPSRPAKPSLPSGRQTQTTSRYDEYDRPYCPRTRTTTYRYDSNEPSRGQDNYRRDESDMYDQRDHHSQAPCHYEDRYPEYGYKYIPADTRRQDRFERDRKERERIEREDNERDALIASFRKKEKEFDRLVNDHAALLQRNDDILAGRELETPARLPPHVSTPLSLPNGLEALRLECANMDRQLEKLRTKYHSAVTESISYLRKRAEGCR